MGIGASGDKLADAYNMHREHSTSDPRFYQVTDDDDADAAADPEDTWADADLAELAELTGVPTDRLVA